MKWPLINENGIPAIVCDIDGTVATMNGRGAFDWKKVGEDIPNQWVIDFIREFLHTRIDVKLVYLSGRDSACEQETRDWLNLHSPVLSYKLFMRPEKDMRSDYIIKQELYLAHVYPNYKVLTVIDDRNQVVRLWNALGIPCLQVHNPGKSNEF